MGRVASAGDNAAHGIVPLAVAEQRARHSDVGNAERSCGSRSSPGSNGPITAGAASAVSGKMTPIEFEALDLALKAA